MFDANEIVPRWTLRRVFAAETASATPSPKKKQEIAQIPEFKVKVASRKSRTAQASPCRGLPRRQMSEAVDDGQSRAVTCSCTDRRTRRCTRQAARYTHAPAFVSGVVTDSVAVPDRAAGPQTRLSDLKSAASMGQSMGSGPSSLDPRSPAPSRSPGPGARGTPQQWRKTPANWMVRPPSSRRRPHNVMRSRPGQWSLRKIVIHCDINSD